VNATSEAVGHSRGRLLTKDRETDRAHAPLVDFVAMAKARRAEVDGQHRGSAEDERGDAVEEEDREKVLEKATLGIAGNPKIHPGCDAGGLLKECGL